MAFQPIQMTAWSRGCILVGEPDSIPDDALRRAVNVRIDRTLGTLSSRPGWTRLTPVAVASGAVLWLAKRYGRPDISYAQIGTTLYRLTDDWTNAVVIATTATATLSDANLADGVGNFFKYLVDGTLAAKDNGTNLWNIGIPAPSAAPLGVSLAADLSVSIDTLDDHTQWTGDGVTGKGDAPTIRQEGVGAVTFNVAASTVGSIQAVFASEKDLDTIPGGDATIKEDDYIHVWIRLDRPDYLNYAQIDFDLDTNTAADTFKRNFYSVRLPALTWFHQGRDQWTQIQVRKSQFARSGPTLTRDWTNTLACRLSFTTNSLGAVQVYADDLKVRGGVDIEGEMDYTVTYHESSTGTTGNPPKDANKGVLFSPKITVKRQRVNVDISNIIEGGVAHPNDPDVFIDNIQVFRRGGSFTDPTLIDTISDQATSPYVDAISENTLLLQEAVSPLETDNDLIPSGTTRVLFGPDAQGILFLIVDGVRIYFCKPFEDEKNRAENWPTNNFFLAGDGSQRALAGITTDTERYFWTARATFQIVGLGPDTFLPVELPGSRSVVGQYAVTTGSGRLFFRAPDGVYEQRGLQQVKLTGAIDPFFHGQTVDGQIHETTTASARAQVRLAYHADPFGSMVMMTYCEHPSTTPNAILVLKQNAQTGLHTEAFFDTSTVTAARSLMVDDEDLALLAGGDDGHVYRLEDHAMTSDASVAIPFRARTRSHDGGLPSQTKHIYQVTVEGTTADVPLAVTAFYDRNVQTEALGTGQSAAPTDEMFFQTADPTARHHDVALEVEGTSTERVALSRIGVFMTPLPENMQAFDTDDMVFDDMHLLKLLRIDLEAAANILIRVYIEETVRDSRTLIAPSTRELVEHHVPAGLKGRAFRVNLTSTAPFRVYGMLGEVKRLGAGQGYGRVSMLQGVG